MTPTEIRERTPFENPEQIGSIRRLRTRENAFAELGKKTEIGKAVIKSLASFFNKGKSPVEVNEIGRAQRVLRGEVPDSEFDFAVFGIRVVGTRFARSDPIGDSDEVFG